ncbi:MULTISPECIES: CpsD/CapB family tyrosine-protein kinase [Thermoanaerobacterium]|uniref:non-specific protein-tyrosine kinase n=1 Tax=Thermoanaerobacterium butyriciformans TaxID=1702242 RepID=A0ABS4NI99_9THEO|nr:CpsD/CapB family tyrosine-protein kinase [Thermoanaerobacterium butyriciformans]MBP2072758.1 capsular exopolysaccharide synthesis family protein [Thermoanaerobacterium butyriciformans]WHE05950.1 CpsD/CapB family tyrosine-protein kinase [Thermoanaerobacterium thermosaccharolyticum]
MIDADNNVYKNNVVNSKTTVSEAFRSLRTNLQFTSVDKKVKSILITSSLPNEGKSTILKNLAYALAMTGVKVIVVDCDLRNPTVHQMFKIPNMSGLTNIIVEDDRYEKYVISDKEFDNLGIITSGPIPPNPSELIGSNRMKIFLDKLKENYDYVLLDAPPVLLVTDPTVLAPVVDGVILVIQANKTEIEATKRAKEILTNVKANILGAVLNKVKEQRSGYYYYYYYNDDGSKHKRKRRKK